MKKVLVLLLVVGLLVGMFCTAAVFGEESFDADFTGECGDTIDPSPCGGGGSGDGGHPGSSPLGGGGSGDGGHPG